MIIRSCLWVGNALTCRHRSVCEMEVVLYTREACELSSRIRDLLQSKGIAYREQVCSGGLPEANYLAMAVTISRVPIVVIDGKAIPANRRAEIEIAVGLIGY